MKGSIEFEIVDLDKCNKMKYLGGFKIGTKFIYLLEHRRFEDGKLTRVQTPSFLVFNEDSEHDDRGQGMPMSKREFDDLLDLFLTDKQIRAINKALYKPVKDLLLQKKPTKKSKQS